MFVVGVVVVVALLLLLLVGRFVVVGLRVRRFGEQGRHVRSFTGMTVTGVRRRRAFVCVGRTSGRLSGVVSGVGYVCRASTGPTGVTYVVTLRRRSSASSYRCRASRHRYEGVTVTFCRRLRHVGYVTSRRRHVTSRVVVVVVASLLRCRCCSSVAFVVCCCFVSGCLGYAVRSGVTVV